MPYAPKMVKKPTPKGGGKGARGENLYTPVSQKTIDKIKSMGMTKALAKAGKTPKGANAEFIQGIKRMYGAKRLDAARSSFAKVAKSPDQARARNAAKTKPVVNKTADQARSRAMSSTKASAPKVKVSYVGAPGNRGGFAGKTKVTTPVAKPKSKPKTTTKPTTKAINYGNRGM